MDTEHKCIDCGNDFVLTDKERAFYEDRNLHLPKRCKPCRDKRKAARDQQ